MMNFLADTWVVPFLVVLTALVFVHELGHYLAARACNVRVEVFSVGFGREIFGWTDRLGTRWKIAMIPVGGYVKMFGEMQIVKREKTSEGRTSDSDNSVAFHTKTLPQRAFIVAAGPAANFIFAVIILSGMFSTIGQPFTPLTIDAVLPNSAAERAGFVVGDKIIGIDGDRVERFEEIIQEVRLNPGIPLIFTVQRRDTVKELRAIPEVINEKTQFGNQSYGRLGIKSTGVGREIRKHGIISAIWEGTAQTYILTETIFSAIGQILKGTRGSDELGGPIRIAQMSGDVWKSGLISFLMFAAILSINLGIINLFPVPLLDGGHLFFYAIEALRGRPVSERTQEYAMRLGLLLVLALMIFATWNDLIQLRVIDFLVNLVK